MAFGLPVSRLEREIQRDAASFGTGFPAPEWEIVPSRWCRAFSEQPAPSAVASGTMVGLDGRRSLRGIDVSFRRVSNNSRLAFRELC